MLKFIQYQLLDDAAAQLELEKSVAADIARNIKQNIAAFRQNIPSLLEIIENHNLQQYSLFCTKSGQVNIVNFATGRVFYGPEPLQDIQTEFSKYCERASFISLDTRTEVNYKPLPAKIDTMIVFGMGMGFHLTELVTNCRIAHLIVYEPNADFLLCSIQAHDWAQLLETAQALGTQIFLQIGSDASSISQDLSELLEYHPEINEIFLYRHQFHPVMDEVFAYLLKHSGDRDKLLATRPVFHGYHASTDYVPEHAGNTNNTYQIELAQGPKYQLVFERNMAALASLYPEIHQTMQTYQCQKWHLVLDDNKNCNLYHIERHALLYNDLAVESAEIVEYFTNHPFKDDVVLGMKTVGKLGKYLHFRTIQKLTPIFEKTLLSQSKLPNDINSLIIFGVALGLHVEELTSNHLIHNLFICEPNLDYFYQSLFVTDWAGIFAKANENKTRIYLNLGGDGSNYFYDLMAQFYQVGAYALADTYMLTSYYTQAMQKAVTDLRGELKVVLALGEYYDHARYGIAHTKASFNNHNLFMKKVFPRQQFKAQDVPVFIVGNGPSLDECYPYIISNRAQAIVVSCGTALKALHARGIKPDFHAEIEQSRATYDWVTRVDDPEYLKGITLLSVNGIHPDTAALFKQTLLCIKEGEASSYIYTEGLKKLNIELASLSYAYPTVTNLVSNYFVRWGFKYFYLLGVDLGYVDINKHHSSLSAYFKNGGTEVYNYQATHGGGIPAPGNFLEFVFTKPEFDVSRKLLEQVISKAGHKIEVYNCSNGVRIYGAQPLLPENILLDDLDFDLSTEIQKLIDNTFHTSLENYGDSIFSAFSMDAYKTSMDCLLDIVSEKINDREQALNSVKKQWAFMREHAVKDADMTFFLMHGSSNYLAGVLTKIQANINEEGDEFVDAFNFVLEIYQDYVREARDTYISKPLALDEITVMDLFQ
ncbi:6-hydroxymethylpterin diphosphokinase MptE-like protein [Rheinheimera sp.]|uniref:6-hydroxymethylpterin diphosphokinase MptE-like protein n=1 Tax=Rheinheimera sp. TaxID=1869214 RepID=UPI003D2869FF